MKTLLFGALVILFPLVLIPPLILISLLIVAWGLAGVTTLTFTQALFITFMCNVVLVYLLQTLFLLNGFWLWIFSWIISVVIISAGALESLVLQRFTDLTQFHSMLAIIGTHLIFSYLAATAYSSFWFEIEEGIKG